MLIRLLLPLVLSLGAVPALAADPTAWLTGEAPLAARLAGIDREWNLSFAAGDKVRVVPAKDLAVWGRYRDADSGPQILLAGGSVIRADVLKLDGDRLVLGDATGLGRGLWDESTLPRSAVRAIVYQPPAGTAARDKLLDQLFSDAAGEDRLLLVGGEMVSGVVAAAPLDGRFLPAEGKPPQAIFELVRRGSTEPLIIPASKVVALSLARLSPASRPAGGVCWLGCRDGSLVEAALVEVEASNVAVKLAAGGTLVTTLAGRDDPNEKFWDAVTLVQPSNPDFIWLSDVKTLGYKHIPFLSSEWPYRADRCVTGSRLRGDGAVFLKGLGMHSTSRLAYDVTGYRRFEAELAIDESSGERGSVIFKVLLQGGAGGAEWTTAYTSPVVRGGDAPLPIALDLKGATRMALIVEFADRGDELDRANWLSARLVK